MHNVQIRNTIEKLANAFRDRPCGEEVLTMNKLHALSMDTVFAQASLC